MRALILRVLERHAGKCLDNERERRAVAAALARALPARCGGCDHELAVHVRGGCLGGPHSACSCKKEG